MLPNIDNKYLQSSSKESVNLSTNNLSIGKIFPTSTGQNKQLKHLHKIPKSISSKNDNRNKKNYRINNTIYKRKNNSAFIDNLYDYPLHKNNHSMISNISNEITDLYSDFNFNKAPSLRQNIYQIHQLIQSNKEKEFHYIKNLYHNSFINNNETNSLNYDDKKTETIDSSKIFKNRNNSCGQLLSNSVRYFNEEENLTSKDIKKNYRIINSLASLSTSAYKTNHSKNQKLNTNLPSQTNRDKDESCSQIISEYKNKKENNNPELNTGKLYFKINDALFENYDRIKKINEFENRILHIKILQNFQYERLNRLTYEKIYSLDNFIAKYTKIIKEYTNKYSKYKITLHGYIKFLDHVISDKEEELLILGNNKKKLEYDIEYLINKIINKQEGLEYLLEIRNFLYRVRYRNSDNIELKNLYIDLNSKIKIESKKYELAIFFKKLFGENKSLAVYKYLCSIPLKKRESVLTKKRVSFYNIDISKLMKKGEKIFSSPDEFISVLEFSEKKNLQLLKTLESRNLDIKKYKKLIEDLNPIDEQRYSQFIMEEIANKTIELSKLKQINNYLNIKFNYYSNKNMKAIDDVRKKKKIKNINSIPGYMGTDLRFYYTRKYNNLIADQKYPGVIFLKRLVEIFNNFITCNYNSYTVKTFYSLITPQFLEEIQETVATGFDAKNQIYINKYIFGMLKLYEFICEAVIDKNREYLKDEKTKIIMRKKNERIQNEKKIKNTKIIMSLIEEKRNNDSKKLIEKWEKRTFYVNRAILSKPIVTKKRNLSQDNIKYNEEIKKENEKDNIYNYMNVTEED